MRSPEEHSPDGGEASRRTLEELQQRNAELAEAVAARDTFIAVAAHELRNPMTPMIGQIDLLLAGLRAGRYSLEQIEQRLGRVQLVMNHYLKRAATLLDVSRITTGKLILAPSPFDLSDLVRETVATFAAAARHAGAQIDVDAPASLLGTWDRLAVEQIIDNLVSNAIKYGAHRPVEVCAEDRGDNVCIRVGDHGWPRHLRGCPDPHLWTL
jgi:two-component system OmpR family sensor kinase